MDEGVRPLRSRGLLVGVISVVAPAYRVEGRYGELGAAVESAARKFGSTLAQLAGQGR